ncbi:hypothetical protein DYH09_31600 [bacterium CPR1]|nr:hypothetical protein [bacterium CPR1]
MALSTLAPPRLGWIRGQANGASLDLSFDRRLHTVAGTANQDSVSLSIDHDRGAIEGVANGHEVELAMVGWTPTRVRLEGEANGQPLNLDVNLGAHTISGSSGQDQWNLRFDHDSLHGTVGSKSVDLELDLSRGQLSGQVNGQAVQAEMVNLDMTDLAPHLYLLAPTR